MIKPKSARLPAYRDRAFDATITIKLNGVAKDLTGYTVACQIREAKSKAPVYAITVVVPSPTTGVILLSLTDAETLSIPEGDYYYDLKVTDDATGLSANYLEGPFIVTDTVTR